MAILGIPLLVVLACAAILIPLGTLLLWSRVRGPRPVRAIARLGMVGAAQLAAILCVAALANDYGQFYTSWSDLSGASSGPGTIQSYGSPGTGRSSRQPFAVGTSRAQSPSGSTTGPATGTLRVVGDSSWSSKSQWRTRGRVLAVTITGDRSHLSDPAYVYLPPQYFQSAYAGRRFPAVEVLTGYPGSALNLVSRMDYPKIALDQVRHNRALPMIYVMLSSTVAPPRDTECTNVPGGPQAESFLARELPSAVAHRFRTVADRWGIVGDSTGGYCAAKIAMYHPSVFRGGVSLSGYYYALSDDTTGDLWGGSLARQHRNDLEWVLAHRPAPRANLYVTISKAETGQEGYPSTMRFLHLVKAPMHVTADILKGGGHNFVTWDSELPRALSWLSTQVTSSSHG